MTLTKRHIYTLLTALLLLPVVPARALPTTVKAKLDSVNLLMGKMTTLHLEVVQDKGVRGEFTFLKDAQSDGVIGLCGDSVELRTDVRRDTSEVSSGRLQINYAIPLQSFDSGFYRLPQFVYVAGRDSAMSNRVTLKVYPVPVTADDPIAGFSDVAEPENPSIFDALPDWLALYWWLWLLIVILLAVLIYGYVRYRQTGKVPLIPVKPQPSPYEEAMTELRRLRARKLWEQGMEKEYFTRLVDILRVYLDKRFGINAMEMTSRQIKQTLSSDSSLRDHRSYMDKVMDMADYVKFAAMRPLPDDNIAAYDDAVRFVEETKPLPEEEEKEEGNGPVRKSAAKDSKGKEADSAPKGKKGGEA